MKKLMYILAAGTTLLAACQPGNTYKVTGTIEGLNDGDTVLIQKIEERKLVPTDTAIVANGQFEFTGTVDSTELRYVTYINNGRPAGTTFFLEKGDINVKMSKDGKNEIKGTATNNTWNAYNVAMDSMYTEMREIYGSIMDTTLTEEARKERIDLLNSKEKVSMDYTTEVIKTNIENPVGIFLLTQNYSNMEPETLESVINMVPEKYQSNQSVVNIKKELETAKKTAVGQPFIDFEMQTPEGETVKLSDFISKNKVTLIDFWASWCGPCRAEMPNVVKAYNEYKNKGFGIVGVSLDNSADAWKKAIKDLNITWPQMSDLKGWECEGAQLYAVRGIPATFMISQEGIIVAKDVRGEEIAKKLDELLK